MLSDQSVLLHLSGGKMFERIKFMVGSFSPRSSRTTTFSKLSRILKSCKCKKKKKKKKKIFFFPVVENAVEWIRIVNHSSPLEWK